MNHNTSVWHEYYIFQVVGNFIVLHLHRMADPEVLNPQRGKEKCQKPET